MPFGHILGQAAAVATLSRALESGHIHHAYRFEGLDGVGKERTALAFAQALLCTTPGEPLGCGGCEACRRVCQFTDAEPSLPLHPDVVLIERGLYSAAALGRDRAESTEISKQQIRRLVLARAPYAPHEGTAQIFILRRADELSTSAANALLKTLEEPRPGTYFVLLTARPDRLLSTIRSRTLPVRFGPLPDDVLRRIVEEHGVPESLRGSAVELAGGSAAAALAGADEEQCAAREQFVQAVLEAMQERDLGKAVHLSEAFDGDRLRLRMQLGALASWFARQARESAHADVFVAERAAKRYGVVTRAMANLERNASVNLTISTLVAALRR